jgi:DNA polymerase III epsilon subunit-like protein
MTMADVMIDLETMGTRPDAPIIAIGAVTFDMRNGTLGEHYYTTVNLASSVELGSRIDASTVMWWLKQDEQARKDVCGGAQQDATLALMEFGLWLHQYAAPEKAVRPWGNGADFDCVILKEHYAKAGITLPWEFWNVRCYRTLAGLYPNIPRQHKGTKHNALDDAIAQAEHLILIRKTLQAKT